MGMPDPIHPDRSRAWHKPNLEGKICAYCGWAKFKLYPGKSTKEVLAIHTDMDTKKRFMDYIDRMIDTYKGGSRAFRDDGPKQLLDRENLQQVKTSVEGTMKLLERYPFGDPRTNGKGHTVTRALWKDGTVRDVVLIPTTADDEMKASWENISGIKLTTNLHDGQMVEDPN